MDPAEPQKSEVHETTADASTAPSSPGDAATTQTHRAPSGKSPKLDPEPPANVHVVRDDTDDGGPLVIQSDDPDLNPPKAPIDPFPTDGTPQIDPPVDKR